MPVAGAVHRINNRLTGARPTAIRGTLDRGALPVRLEEPQVRPYACFSVGQDTLIRGALVAELGVEHRLAAILAADVAGCTRLMADDERATIATLADYRYRFRAYITANGGRDKTV